MGGSENEIKGLLFEYWAEVYRAGRRLHLHGPITVSQYSGTIAHELSLGPRDFPILNSILAKCVTADGSAVVDLAKLKEFVADSDNEQEGNTEWMERCGLVKPKARRADTAGARRKYDIENHGSPFAIAGDAKATLRLKQEEHIKLEAKIKQQISEVAAGGRISRKHLSKIVRDNLDVTEAEIEELLKVLDPKRTNSLSVEIFNTHYLFELMKPKSLRRSVMPVVVAESATQETLPSPRGSSPRKASPRGRSAHGSPRSGTKASQLRQDIGSLLRKSNESSAVYENWLTKRSTSPREAAKQAARGASASPRNAKRDQQKIPSPPRTGIASFPRLNTAVKTDGVVMGNLRK